MTNGKNFKGLLESGKHCERTGDLMTKRTFIYLWQTSDYLDDFEASYRVLDEEYGISTLFKSLVNKARRWRERGVPMKDLQWKRYTCSCSRPNDWDVRRGYAETFLKESS